MHLLERHQQLETLTRCFQAARNGTGKLVFVAGEAGLGKSSLIERFVSEHRRDARTLWGACDALSTPRALAPVHEIAAQTNIGERASREGDARDWLFRNLLEDLSRRESSACIVVLEDLHWADEATLDFLRFIGRRIQRTSALFIVSYRDEELSATHPVRLTLGEIVGEHVVRVRLAPLSFAAVEVLARESGRDAQVLHRTTEGNPFFIREALASPDDTIPDTVRDALLARLMRCSAPARELAELVSISPGRTETWLIDAVLGPRQTAADEAGARGLLDVHTDSVGFRHELARLATLSSIPADRSRSMHAQVFERLRAHGADPARLVHHAALSDNTAAVLEYAPLAATEAGRLGAHREAAAHLNTALRFGTTLPTELRARLLEQHAHESALANLPRQAIESANSAIALWQALGNDEAQSWLLRLVAQEYRTVGDMARADESAAGAVAIAEALPRGPELSMAYGARSLLYTHRGWHEEALEFGKRAWDLARELDDRAAESNALCHIGGALLGLGDRSGYAQLERSLEVALAGKLEDIAARAYRTLQFYASLIRDFDRAQRAFNEGVEYCEERGIFSHSAYIRTYYTTCVLDRGEWTEAARMSAELMGNPEVTGVTQRVTVMTTLALVRLRRGDPGAIELLDQALELATPTGELSRIARCAAARAEYAWYVGNVDDIVRNAEIGLATLRGHASPWLYGELQFWHSRVRPAEIGGAVAEPYRLMLAGEWRNAAEQWREIGAPYELALALAEGPEEGALRESLSIADKLGAAPLAAFVRRRLREIGVRGVPRGPNETTRGNPSGLTARELEVLQLLSEGCTSAQLARRLHRSPKTVDHHIGALFEKLGVHSRAEAVAAAFARGIVPGAKGGKSTP